MENTTLENYSLKFDRFNIRFIDYCTNFKEAELGEIRNTMINVRLGKVMHFKSFAKMTFSEPDENYDTTINIEELGKFGRGKTNAVIFSIDATEKNKGKYNRCLIYQHIAKNDADSMFGYIMFNTETGIMSHVYCLTHTITVLFQRMFQSLDVIQREELYNYHMHKIDDITALSIARRNKKVI